MNILVCISRVPDTASRIVVGSDGKSIDSGGLKFVVNPYDELGIEEALQLKQKNGGEVTAITVGTEKNTDVLRTALAMGVDKAVLIKGDEPGDSFYVAENIAKFAKTYNPDLIFLGKQSVDFDSLQIPSILAEKLDMPSVSVVSELSIDAGKVTAERDIEGGRETVEAAMPCIISCQKGLNEPRYPKLPDIMKAKKKPIEEIDAEKVDPKVSILSMEIPSKKRVGKVLTDSDEDIKELVKLLHEEAKII